MTEKRKGRRGRPPFRATIKDRVSVEQMKFCGESENTIARAIGIDVDTLRKHFGEELENGHANRSQQVIGWLFESAEKGNVTARKHLENLGRVAGAAAQAGEGREPAPVPPKLGKKEARQAAAEAVAGTYAVPAGPKLIVSNG